MTRISHHPTAYQGRCCRTFHPKYTKAIPHLFPTVHLLLFYFGRWIIIMNKPRGILKEEDNQSVQTETDTNHQMNLDDNQELLLPSTHTPTTVKHESFGLAVVSRLPLRIRGEMCELVNYYDRRVLQQDQAYRKIVEANACLRRQVETAKIGAVYAMLDRTDKQSMQGMGQVDQNIVGLQQENKLLKQRVSELQSKLIGKDIKIGELQSQLRREPLSVKRSKNMLQ